MLAARRLTSHSQGPGSVSSKSFRSNTSRRSGDANTPKFDKMSVAAALDVQPGAGRRRQVAGHDSRGASIERERRDQHPPVANRHQLLHTRRGLAFQQVDWVGGGSMMGQTRRGSARHLCACCFTARDPLVDRKMRQLGSGLPPPRRCPTSRRPGCLLPGCPRRRSHRRRPLSIVDPATPESVADAASTPGASTVSLSRISGPRPTRNGLSVACRRRRRRRGRARPTGRFKIASDHHGCLSADQSGRIDRSQDRGEDPNDPTEASAGRREIPAPSSMIPTMIVIQPQVSRLENTYVRSYRRNEHC